MIKTIDTKGPVATPPDPDGDRSRWRERPCFYVTAIYNDEYAVLAGPFPTHQQALDKVRIASDLVAARDHRGPWCGYGTAKFPDGSKTGQFNMACGVNLDAITSSYTREVSKA